MLSSRSSSKSQSAFSNEIPGSSSAPYRAGNRNRIFQRAVSRACSRLLEGIIGQKEETKIGLERVLCFNIPLVNKGGECTNPERARAIISIPISLEGM